MNSTKLMLFVNVLATLRAYIKHGEAARDLVLFLYHTLTDICVFALLPIILRIHPQFLETIMLC